MVFWIEIGIKLEEKEITSFSENLLLVGINKTYTYRIDLKNKLWNRPCPVYKN